MFLTLPIHPKPQLAQQQRKSGKSRIAAGQAVGLSGHVSRNGSYVTEKMFAVRKHGASFSPHGAMASSLAPPTPGAPVA